MIKTYKSLTEYWQAHWLYRQKASQNYKNWLTELIKIEKGMNYIEVDKEAIIAQHMINITKWHDSINTNK